MNEDIRKGTPQEENTGEELTDDQLEEAAGGGNLIIVCIYPTPED